GSFLWIVNNIYFQYYSVLITIVSIAVMLLVSYTSPAPAETQMVGLTYATITPEQRRQSRASWTQLDVVASCVIVLAILGAYLYFNGERHATEITGHGGAGPRSRGEHGDPENEVSAAPRPTRDSPRSPRLRGELEILRALRGSVGELEILSALRGSV